MQFLVKTCFYFKHFLYLYIINKTICLVTFADSIIEKFRESISDASNVTCESREACCLVPIIF